MFLETHGEEDVTRLGFGVLCRPDSSFWEKKLGSAAWIIRVPRNSLQGIRKKAKKPQIITKTQLDTEPKNYQNTTWHMNNHPMGNSSQILIKSGQLIYVSNPICFYTCEE